MRLADGCQVGQRGEVSVDAEDRVGDHHRPRVRVVLQGIVHGGHVAVRVDAQTATREAARVDDRGVVVGIGQQQGLAIAKSGDRGQVGQIPRGEGQDCFGFE